MTSSRQLKSAKKYKIVGLVYDFKNKVEPDSGTTRKKSDGWFDFLDKRPLSESDRIVGQKSARRRK